MALVLTAPILLSVIVNALTWPIHKADVKADESAAFVWRYPHKRVVRLIEREAIPKPSVVRSMDSDGDEQFVALLGILMGRKDVGIAC